MSGPLDRGHIISPGKLTPTPQRQAAFVGFTLLAAGAASMTLGTAIYTARKVRSAASIHRKTVGPVTSVLSMYSTVDSIMRIRSGGHKPAFSVKYEPYDPWWVPPIPYIGSIPIIRPRLDIGTRPIEQSRGGEHTLATAVAGHPSAGLSTPGPSAQNKPRASRTKPRGKTSRANRRGAPSSGRRRPRSPKKWCRRHKRYDYCYMR